MSHNPADYGTAEEAKTMPERAVAAVKEDKAKALETLYRAGRRCEDRDLYACSANVTDGIYTAHAGQKRKQLKAIVRKKGSPLGKDIMDTAPEGKISEITSWWPRPGSDKPL